MVWMKEKSEQRGTLLVEALAMLGLIAMVTPTLYKKSAERMQEIQDINIASQARTMNSVVETMMKANVTDLLEATSSAASSTILLTYDDSASATCPSGYKCFAKGYSAYVPFGFNVGEIKNYQMPKVYVHNDHSSLTSYIVYPKDTNIGRKRAAKIASLIGANGGTVWTESSQVSGTGAAWDLDSSMISDLKMDTADLTEDSLVITSVEPVSIDSQDSEKFLYRVPPDEGNSDAYYHNMMVTDLYMGGIGGDEAYGDYARQFHSIYNTRKLMLNTACDRMHINGASEDSTYCDPSIADLYVGKPFGNYLTEDNHSPGSGTNNGAAWIYGNLSALNERFSLRNTQYAIGGSTLVRTGADIMEFVRVDATGDVDMFVFRADNGENGGSAAVGLLDDFVLAHESSGALEFLVGGSSVAAGGVEGGYIHAYAEGGDHILKLNSREDSTAVTFINDRGGKVYINQNGSSAAGALTNINQDGGTFTVGENAGKWIEAAGTTAASSVVYILKDNVESGDARIFAVGGSAINKNMIYADSSYTSLRNGQLRVYGKEFSHDADNVGGLGIAEYGSPAAGDGALLVNTKYADILSSTFMTNTNKQMMSSGVDGLSYKRGDWTLGVAGSAWVDDLLFANEAWFNDQGSKDLHAGFSSYTQFKNNRHTGWLNVYGGDAGGVYIRHGADNTTGKATTSSAVFWADSTTVQYQDLKGGFGYVKDGSAVLGWKDLEDTSKMNYFAADSSKALVSGSSWISILTSDGDLGDSEYKGVDIQNHALTLRKHPDIAVGANTSLGNRIDARAGEFALWTTGPERNSVKRDSSDAQFYATSSAVRTRYVNFAVENKNSSAVFKVMPDLEDLTTSSDANVMMDGTVHITGNRVIHVASNASNSAAADENRAMFEVDPDYIQVMGIGDAGFTSNPLFRIGAKDVAGASSIIDNSGSASVYIRRGAIELEHTDTAFTTGGDAADSGVGYIKADRLVSGARKIKNTTGNGDEYDQFMVNPAYTSVMHDIKLTTRGGARLSDVLPDYVLKGVYNVSNNCQEGETEGGANYTCDEAGFGQWASPYVGIVPYAPCPPGYKNLATIVPISFQMAQAGDLVLRARTGGEYWAVDFGRQAVVLSSDKPVLNPKYEQASSFVLNSIYNADDTHGLEEFYSHTSSRVEGWFLGVKPEYKDSDWSEVKTSVEWDSEGNYLVYDNSSVVPYPLYFQQNTWLKTSLIPNKSSGWNAYVGFIYDSNIWGESIGKDSNKHNGQGSDVRSNNNDGADNEDTTGAMPGFVWNLFPVATNTIEGHATVYCYFDRTKFDQYTDSDDKPLVDPLTLLGNANPRKRPDTAVKDDPTLKYKDPWGGGTTTEPGSEGSGD